MPTATDQIAEKMSDAEDAKSTTLDDTEDKTSDGADAKTAAPEETSGTPKAPEVAAAAIAGDTTPKSQATKVRMDIDGTTDGFGSY